MFVKKMFQFFEIFISTKRLTINYLEVDFKKM